MADGLLLAGQRAMPAKAQGLGFKFRFERVENAIAAVLSGRSSAKVRRAFHPASRP
jgi:NAD dependent epimerase/dehydratase family enzyme